MRRDSERVYGDSAGQIGKTKGQTYLAAMLQVYGQLASVLRPGAVACLLIRNPVRKRKIRQLGACTPGAGRVTRCSHSSVGNPAQGSGQD